MADLGCGPGHFTIAMAERAGEGGRVYAVDFDAKAIERVAKKAEARGLAGSVMARAGSAAEVGFIPDRSVDFVFAHGLLCCMKDHAGALRQIRRILKADGQAYLSVTRFGRKGDPRSVSAEEWKGMLERFRVKGSGGGLLTRWAVVALDDQEHGESEGGPAGAAPGTACCR